MKKAFILAVMLCFCSSGLYAGAKKPVVQELPTVQQVELQKYLGLWYEIARFPV